MTLTLKDMISHPFASRRKEDFVRVHSIEEQVGTVDSNTILDRRPHFQETQDSKGMFCKVVPLLGDLVFVSGNIGVMDQYGVDVLGKTEAPIPLLFNHVLVVGPDVEELDYVWLRGDDREKLLDWVAKFGC